MKLMKDTELGHVSGPVRKFKRREVRLLHVLDGYANVIVLIHQSQVLTCLQARTLKQVVPRVVQDWAWISGERIVFQRDSEPPRLILDRSGLQSWSLPCESAATFLAA